VYDADYKVRATLSNGAAKAGRRGC
jgi:hypothetical protein